jgi:hypothetical protein
MVMESGGEGANLADVSKEKQNKHLDMVKE